MILDYSFWIDFIIKFNYFILYYLIIVNLIYTLLFILSIGALYIHRQKNKYWSYDDMMVSSYTPPLSIIVPCYNEAETITDNIKALLSLEYSEFELVIVNDGSKDDTLEIIKKEFGFKKIDMPYKHQIKTKEVKNIYLSTTIDNIILLDKENGGKADALNAGINMANYPLITAIDADSIIERNSLVKVVRPFVEDPSVIISGGVVRPVNDVVIDKGFIEKIKLGEKALVRFQIVEYLRAFLFGRIGWGTINCLMIISGAFGVFNKKIVIDAGGYSEDTIGEDMELVVKIHRKMKENKKKYRIVFVPDPVCWTQVPEDLKTLKNQRKRWHKGLMDAMLNHTKMLLNPRYGLVGIIAMPYYFFIEMLGPVIEIVGYISFILSFWFGIISFEFALAFFGFAVVYGVFLSSGAILLDEYNFKKYDGVKDYLVLMIYSVLENFGYRQMTTWWRFVSFWQYRRNKNKWGEMKRKSF
ncbi:cellulose synthase/poly-beta-1,6-N-acetylglucosamine synthase-like glycosyltransferase [Acetoanaerobium pronyense]|uniref:Cellulose synthase/poly-beta-1,6-N-acetylglucosamine synthase-like glycosyltransferase n=2 Tax=Acetoanaerobium pronyense TaxID=1482736 RepID=A0ABS4KMF8_9FIRM|nr:cellulose synthase/poly-beta-1,6-N-acetylglucosamine synthase-like glycosyltransferase [Acetoanaerobium pronyense]